MGRSAINVNGHLLIEDVPNSINGYYIWVGNIISARAVLARMQLKPLQSGPKPVSPDSSRTSMSEPTFSSWRHKR
jgi:hypothetical protein